MSADKAGRHPSLKPTLQAALQKIDLQRLLTDLALQVGDPAFRPALPPIARKHVARPLPELTPPVVQHVRVHFQSASHFAQRHPLFQPLDRRQLELLDEYPSRQSHDSILL